MVANGAIPHFLQTYSAVVFIIGIELSFFFFFQRAHVLLHHVVAWLHQETSADIAANSRVSRNVKSIMSGLDCDAFF